MGEKDFRVRKGLIVDGTGTSSIAGSLGIGTSSPNGNLHVVGASSDAARIYVSDSDEGTGTGDSLLITKSGNKSYIYDRLADSDLYLGANNDSDILVIDGTNARVGIGTTSPVSRLDLNTGALSFANTNTQLKLSGGSNVDFQLGHWGNTHILIDTDGNDSSRYFSVRHGNATASSATELFKVHENGTTTVTGSLEVSSGITGEVQPKATTAVAGNSTPDYYAKLLTFNPNGNTHRDCNLILGVTIHDVGNSGSAIINVKFRSFGATEQYTADVAFMSKTGVSIFDQDAFQIFSDGNLVAQDNNTDIELWVKKNVSYASLEVHEISKAITGNTTLTYHTDSAWQSSAPTNNTFTTTTQGIELNLDKVRMGISGVATYLHLHPDAANSFIYANTSGSDVTLAADDDLTLHADDDIFFQAGGATKMTLLNTGELGIGTTSPDAKLHVEGSVLIDAYEAGAGAGLFFREGFLNTNQPSITVQDHSGANPDGLAISAYDGISFRLNAVEKARFDSSGNLGIGTTSPDQLLHVVGSSNDDTVALFSTTGGTGGSTQGTVHIGLSHFSSDANPSVRIGAEENGTGSYQAAMTFGTRSATSDAAPVERMRLTHNGQLLLTNGTSAAVAAGSVGIVEDGDTVEIRNQHGIINIGSTNTSYMHITTDRSRFYFDESLVVNDGMVSSYDEDLQLKRAQSDDEKIVVGDNSMTFTSAGNDVVTVDGTNTRLGIGTTSPDTLFEIKEGGTGAAVMRLRNSNTSYPADTAFGRIEFYNADSSGAGITAQIEAVSDASGRGGQLAFKTDPSGTSPSTRMFIQGDGNVGIGVTEPTDTLAVSGGIKIGEFNSTDGTGYAGTSPPSDHNNATGAADPQIRVAGRTSDQPGIIQMALFDNNNFFGGTGAFTLGKLQFAMNENSNTVTTVAEIRGITSDPQVAGNFDGALKFFTSQGDTSSANLTEKMILTADGNLGIGTTSPDGPLHIYHTDNTGVPGITIETNGGAAQSDSKLRIKESHGSATWVDFTVNTYGQLEITGGASTRRQIFTADEPDTDASGVISLNKDHYEWDTQIFGDSSTPVIYVDGTNNRMGVGTTSPSVPLEVNGEIKGSKINLSSGTDAFTIQSSNPLREKKIYATTSGDGSPFDEMVFHSEGSTGGWSGQHTFTVSKSEDDDPDVFSPYTAFRIRDSGNGTSSEVLVSHKLGVGILDPVPMFHIYGNNSTTNQTTSGAASITIENDGAGDAALNFLLTGTRRWIAGIDNSDGDKFKISTGGTDLQTGTKLTVDTSGNAVIAGDVQAATASITGLMTSGTALINSSHSFSNTPAITTNGAAINGTNTTKVRAESSTYSFSQSYTLAGNLNNSTELELFRFNVTNASYRKFQAGRMFIRVQVTNPQSGGSGFFQQTVTFGDDAGGGAAQSTTDRIDSNMTGGNAAYDHEKATIVVSRVSDYICVKFRNETGVAILTSSGFQAQLSCELFELDAMPS